MRTILVTGGAGFVGSGLAIGVKEARPDSRVIALDNLMRRGAELNLPRLKEARVEFVHGDVRNPEDLEGVGPIDLILECSAEPSVLAGYDESPRYLLNTNLMGTINCLEIARKHGAGIIFFSTSRVYPMESMGNLTYTEEATRFVLQQEQPFPGVSAQGIAESFPLDGIRSLYGTTKLSSELILQEYLAMYDICGIVNRCGVLSGPWQMGKVDQGVVVLWAARHLFEKELSYFGYGGTGKQVRDVLHVRDLLRLVLHQMEHLSELSGETFNVGGGLEVSTSLCELTMLCQELTGNTIPIHCQPEDRVADIPIYITDNAKVTERCGWKPEATMQAIVGEIVDWIRANEDTLRPILG